MCIDSTCIRYMYMCKCRLIQVTQHTRGALWTISSFGPHPLSHWRCTLCCSWLHLPGLLAHEIPWILHLCLHLTTKTMRLQRMLHQAFHLGTRDSDSGPDTLMVSPLPAEPPLLLKERTNSLFQKDWNNWTFHFQIALFVGSVLKENCNFRIFGWVRQSWGSFKWLSS